MSDVDFPRPLIFAAYAGDDVHRWSEVVGEQVVHRQFGTGEIVNVRKSNAGNVVVSVAFRDDKYPKRDLTSGVFRNTQTVLDMTVSKVIEGIEQIRAVLREEQLKEEAKKEARERKRRQEEREHQDQAEQRAREARAREEFATLKQKYGALNYASLAPTSPLYPILLKLEAGEMLLPDQIKWLENFGIFAPLAFLEEQTYERTGDVWCLVRASRGWRDVHQPARAVKATARARTAGYIPNNARSALLTTRGGAFRDLGQLNKAENCAKEAILAQPQTYYTYNLLGGIYYDRGDHTTGDRYFSEALERGASPRSQDHAIRESIEKQEYASQRATAEYLLNKDPKRFAWAQHYLE